MPGCNASNAPLAPNTALRTSTDDGTKVIVMSPTALRRRVSGLRAELHHRSHRGGIDVEHRQGITRRQNPLRHRPPGIAESNQTNFLHLLTLRLSLSHRGAMKIRCREKIQSHHEVNP